LKWLGSSTKQSVSFCRGRPNYVHTQRVCDHARLQQASFSMSKRYCSCLWTSRIRITSPRLAPQPGLKESSRFLKESLPVISQGEAKGYLITVPFPIGVLGSTPRNSDVALQLAYLAQRTEAVHDSAIGRMQCNTEPIILVAERHGRGVVGLTSVRSSCMPGRRHPARRFLSLGVVGRDGQIPTFEFGLSRRCCLETSALPR